MTKIKPLAKLTEKRKVRGDLAHRATVYIDVHENSSTNKAKQFALLVAFRTRFSKGFTLIEILISIVIITILASIATTFSSNIISKWQMKSVIQDIESAVILARNLALTQEIVVYIESINKDSWSSGIQVIQVEASNVKNLHSQCSRFGIGQTNTTEGKRIYSKVKNHALCEGSVSSTRHIVRIFQWFYPKLHVHWSGFQYKDKIRFANNLINAGSNGHFIIELAGNKQKIVLNRIGHIRFLT